MKKLLVILCAIFFVNGCATFGVEINGKFDKEPVKNVSAKKVNVLFIFDHKKQLEGLDAIPKLVGQQMALKDFNDIFLDAVKEFSNLNNYNIISETAYDILWSDKSKKKETLKKNADYIIETTILKKESFARNFLGGMVSLVTLTLVPVSYPKDYEFVTKVYDAKETVIKEYKRAANLKEWLHLVMLFYYPYHSPEKATEEMYSTILHNIFKEIENDKLLI